MQFPPLQQQKADQRQAFPRSRVSSVPLAPPRPNLVDEPELISRLTKDFGFSNSSSLPVSNSPTNKKGLSLDLAKSKRQNAADLDGDSQDVKSRTLPQPLTPGDFPGDSQMPFILNVADRVVPVTIVDSSALRMSAELLPDRLNVPSAKRGGHALAFAEGPEHAIQFYDNLFVKTKGLGDREADFTFQELQDIDADLSPHKSPDGNFFSHAPDFSSYPGSGSQSPKSPAHLSEPADFSTPSNVYFSSKKVSESSTSSSSRPRRPPTRQKPPAESLHLEPSSSMTVSSPQVPAFKGAKQKGLPLALSRLKN